MTLLHQYQRGDEPTDGVTIRATEHDYGIARRLLAGPFARALGDGLSDAARNFGERLAERFANGFEFDTNDAKKREPVIGDVQTIRRYVRELASVGFLDVVQAKQGPKPARYRVADRPRDDGVTAGLPEVADIFGSG
ncbi:MAG: hypothetical protein IH986_14100 [Planctomycetes bacterium]|nr:hypothetical protein [Planctomycetota bacterium]